MALVSASSEIPVLFSYGKGQRGLAFQYLKDNLAHLAANNISAVILEVTTDPRTGAFAVTRSVFKQVCAEQIPVLDFLEDLKTGIDSGFSKIKPLCKYVDLVFVVGLSANLIKDLPLLFRPTFLECSPSELVPFVVGFLKRLIQAAPLCGCILVGGKSSRMGQPKQLISYKGSTWFELIYAQLSKVCREVLVAGKGDLPAGDWQRVYDDDSSKGPLSGILAAMSSKPAANFLVCSCDLPYINGEAVNWLLQQSEPGVWAILPGLKKDIVEPLFAYYDHKMLSVLQKLALDERYKLLKIADHSKAKVVRPPADLRIAWTNCNTTGDIPAE